MMILGVSGRLAGVFGGFGEPGLRMFGGRFAVGECAESVEELFELFSGWFLSGFGCDGRTSSGSFGQRRS